MPESQINFTGEVLQNPADNSMSVRLIFSSEAGIATILNMPGAVAERISEVMAKLGKQARLGIIVTDDMPQNGNGPKLL